MKPTMRPVPILMYSDNPGISTGLARITKDITLIASRLPQFRVGTYGRGGHMTTQLPWAQYQWQENEGWGEEKLPSVWTDFSRGEPGILFCIQDVSRLNWLVNPVGIDGYLGDFLRNRFGDRNFKTWLYCPVDGYGVGGRMTTQCADSLGRFDRLLAYSLFGKDVLEKTTGKEVDWIPHGYNGNAFQPRGKEAGRAALRVGMGAKLIGCVMANQERKDWGTAFGTVARLKDRYGDLKFWAHCDMRSRYWNLDALAADFRLEDTVIFTESGEFNSEQLSYLYSACDVTFLPSLGEGWGFTNIESLACGVPCINGRYAAVVESTPVHDDWLVEPTAERLTGPWNIVRPVWNPELWAEKVEKCMESYTEEEAREVCTRQTEHLKYENLGKVWEKWMLEGLD